MAGVDLVRGEDVERAEGWSPVRVGSVEQDLIPREAKGRRPRADHAAEFRAEVQRVRCHQDDFLVPVGDRHRRHFQPLIDRRSRRPVAAAKVDRPPRCDVAAGGSHQEGGAFRGNILADRWSASFKLHGTVRSVPRQCPPPTENRYL